MTDGEVYDSYEYKQYLLILDEQAAFFNAREELIATLHREALPYR